MKRGQAEVLSGRSGLMLLKGDVTGPKGIGTEVALMTGEALRDTDTVKSTMPTKFLLIGLDPMTRGSSVPPSRQCCTK